MIEKKIEEIENHINDLIIMLQKTLLPYFYLENEIDELLEEDLFSDTLARAFNNLIFYQQKPKDFYADSILPRKVIINEKNTIQFLGLIHWLEVPSNYLNDDLKDVFYCDFILENAKITIKNICFGSQDKIDLETLWWSDFDINWTYKLKN